MDTIAPIESFPGFTAEAFRAAAYTGAAKATPFLGAASIRFLDDFIGETETDRATSVDPLIIEKIPEFNPVRALLDNPANQRYGLRVEVSARQLLASGGSQAPAHCDSVAPYGFSILVPYDGPPAVFGAADQLFFMSTDSFRKPTKRFYRPAYAAEYATGDGMLVRQGVRWFNGLWLDSGPTYHLGAAHGRRKILLVDFLARDITVNS